MLPPNPNPASTNENHTTSLGESIWINTKCWSISGLYIYIHARIYIYIYRYKNIEWCFLISLVPQVVSKFCSPCDTFSCFRGLAAIVEVAFVYTVKLPVEPMLFRLLRVGKLIRAIRMAPRRWPWGILPFRSLQEINSWTLKITCFETF